MIENSNQDLTDKEHSNQEFTDKEHSNQEFTDKEHRYLPNKSRILGVSSLAGSGAAAAEAANGLLALAVLRNFSIAAALEQSIRSIVTIDRYNRSLQSIGTIDQSNNQCFGSGLDTDSIRSLDPYPDSESRLGILIRDSGGPDPDPRGQKCPINVNFFYRNFMF
jgi:hypothetical protein